MTQRMIWLSGLVHLALIAGLVAFKALPSGRLSLPGVPVYQVDLVSMPASALSRQLPVLDEPYRMVTRKEAAAPDEKADMALQRTPKLVAEEPKKAPAAAPSFTTSTPGVRLDVEAFEYPYYLAAIHRKIQEDFVVPRIPGVRYLETMIYFRIGKDGKIYNMSVEQSSSNPTFDLASQRALESANPLPPLPSEYDRDYLGVHFAFEYTP